MFARTLAVSLVLFAIPAVAEDADRAALEKKFSQTLNDVTMDGNFTIDARQGDRPPAKDKYTISSVKKVKGAQWVITARIQYLAVDLEVPVPVEVKWAGDTPVIMLTDVGLPGMTGKFSTRLLIEGNRYAGTWQHDKVGGHMWGKIVNNATPAKPAHADQKN